MLGQVPQFDTHCGYINKCHIDKFHIINVIKCHITVQIFLANLYIYISIFICFGPVLVNDM